LEEAAPQLTSTRAASKSLEPEWKDLLKLDEKSADNMVSFDCAANLKTCKDLDVVSYPAIRLYHRDGRIDRYRGPRKAAS
jgi:protein disulfide-isomerase A1